MKIKTWRIFTVILLVVFVFSIVALIFSYELNSMMDVIGIRIAVLIVAFASFGSSTLFSLLIYSHNRTITRINDDSNRRAELFRELQFASSNYSIIEFSERMLITKERPNYVSLLTKNKTPSYHMIEEYNGITEIKDNNYDNYRYYTIRIPFKVIEGKMISKLTLEKIRFERDDEVYIFNPNNEKTETQAYILYNEYTKRNNLIMNVVTNKDSNFFSDNETNKFSKIKIFTNITSLLGVKVKGLNELYFTNPDTTEGNGINSYYINSSNFTLLQRPMIENLSYDDYVNI